MLQSVKHGNQIHSPPVPGAKIGSLTMIRELGYIGKDGGFTQIFKEAKFSGKYYLCRCECGLEKPFHIKRFREASPKCRKCSQTKAILCRTCGKLLSTSTRATKKRYCDSVCNPKFGWDQGEIDFLERKALLYPPKVLCKKLKEAAKRNGWKPKSLVAMRSQLGKMEIRKADLVYVREWWTAGELASLFRVSAHTIAVWIKSGLKASESKKALTKYILRKDLLNWAGFSRNWRSLSIADPEALSVVLTPVLAFRITRLKTGSIIETEGRRSRTRSVRCLELDRRFNSLREASEFCGLEEFQSKVLNNSDRTFGGYHWIDTL